MSTIPHDTNRLLSLIPTQDNDALVAHGAIVSLIKGNDLARAGDAIKYCWFPLSGLVSVIASDTDDHQAEVGVIGYDGMVNSSILLGSHRSAMRILVQIGGSALRVDARSVLAITAQSERTFGILAAFHQTLAVQAAYSALAYAQYPVVRRLARWVLMCADRVGDAQINLTHEALSTMLGVRRAGVTVALANLEQTGAVIRRRGGMSIANRGTLLAIAGSSYGPAEAEYKRLIRANTDSVVSDRSEGAASQGLL